MRAAAKISREAQAAHDRAGACIDERRFVDAIGPALEATRLAPDWSSPWFNLAVAYKHALRWDDVLRAIDRAFALDRDDAQSDVGLHWNAGIAATALGDWARARASWTAAGITVPAGDGRLTMELGLTPIRVSLDGDTEVLWCERIDPCRAVIISVPLPSCGRRHGDLLLHDGEPRGRRHLDGRDVAVFDELTLLYPSNYGTWEATFEADGPDDVARLLARFEDTPAAVEDWTGGVRQLCTACSLGTPHDDHDDAGEPGWQRTRRLGLAAVSEADLRPLRTFGLWWRRGIRDVRRVL